ncbi:alpha/beta hydrolase fold domain-containing protein [Pseudomonas entomophila]|uniref:alpha/beta hydrolase fold domain-containing protein n=1 Tax=Pseudomonas entomophila TaxID=312306 RepID=UPI001F017CA8|nr:alpha/beta hydrolase [Pseudomonas entomophila]MCG8291359.1 alpha/beta hydrolase [Pseudomonas entomophila]
MNAPASVRADTRVIDPIEGRCKRRLLNLLLRVLVKSRHGLGIDIPHLRKQFAQLDRQGKALPTDVHRVRVSCSGTPAHWLSPASCRPERVVLYIHGGAFVAYTPQIYAAMVAGWCKPLKARALMLDYSLAPESPFPTALDQAQVAYRWLLEQGVKAEHIVLAGDSAGGNLALALLQRLRDDGAPLPSCGVLLSPFLDFTLSGASVLGNARHDPIFTLPFAIAIRGFYAPAEQHASPAVSPLFGSFDGLPPLLLQVGSSEMLLDDAVRAAAKAAAAGVAVRLEIWQQLPHVFQMIAALPQAQEAQHHILDFINDHTNWDG